jgi:hypothetical protein
MLITVFLISIVFVALAFAGLGLNILFRKNGKFPDTEVGHNKNMRNLGITCSKADEIKMLRQERRAASGVTAATQLPLRDCGIGCSCVSEEL